MPNDSSNIPPLSSVSAVISTNFSALSSTAIGAFNSNGSVGLLPVPTGFDAESRLPPSASTFSAIRNLDFEAPSVGPEVEYEEEEDEIEEEEEEDLEEDEDYEEEIENGRPKLMSSGSDASTLQQLKSLISSLPEGENEAQFEIVIDGPDGTENKVLRVNSAGEIITSPSLDVSKPAAEASSSPSSSPSEMQHFVTFDENGREIHFVAPSATAAPSFLSSVNHETINSQNVVSAGQQVVQIPDGGGFSTMVVGDESLQSLTHVLDDNVTVLNEDGLVVDNVGSEGTFYQLITEDGSTIVTSGENG